MKSILIVLFVTIPQFALANNITAGASTSLLKNANSETYSIEIKGPVAAQIYDFLQVPEVSGWEDILSMSKSAAGIYAFSNGQGPNRYAQVDLQFDPKSGLMNLSTSKDDSQILSVNIDGSAGEQIYALLQVSEQSMDPEFFDFQKIAPGLTCFKTRAVGVDCIVAIDPKNGALK